MTENTDPDLPGRPDLPDDPDSETRARRPWMARFLVELAERGIVADACAVALVSRSQAYWWRNEDPSFALDWADAHEQAMDKLEAEAVRRAARGIEEPVIHQGQLSLKDDGTPLTVTRYSDVLLMFLLNGGRSEKYRRGSVDVNVKLDQQATDIIGALADELTEAVSE